MAKIYFQAHFWELCNSGLFLFFKSISIGALVEYGGQTKYKTQLCILLALLSDRIFFSLKHVIQKQQRLCWVRARHFRARF